MFAGGNRLAAKQAAAKEQKVSMMQISVSRAIRNGTMVQAAVLLWLCGVDASKLALSSTFCTFPAIIDLSCQDNHHQMHTDMSDVQELPIHIVRRHLLLVHSAYTSIATPVG